MAPAWVLLDACVEHHLIEEDDGSAAAAVKAVASKALPMFQNAAETTIALLGSMKPDVFLPDPPEIATFSLLGSKTHLKYGLGGCSLVACADKSLLVVYGGTYTGPGSSPRGCYLVFDAAAAASSPPLSTVPPIPEARYLTGIGVGTAVLRRQSQTPSSAAYFLAELVTSPSRDLPDAELYLWRSDEQPTPQWARKEVRLPREVRWEDGKHDFRFDASFSVPWTDTDTLCWVDLLHGIVVCTNPEADNPAFSFIPFPADCPAFAVTEDRPFRTQMEDVRSVACVGGAIKLVAVVGVLEGWSSDKFKLTTWTHLRDLNEWQLDGSFLIKDLWATDKYCDLQVPPRVPIRPVLSLSEDGVVYAVVNDLVVHHIRQGSNVVRTESDFKCQYVLGLDIRNKKIISTSSRHQLDMVQLRPRLLATDFCASLQGKNDPRQREVGAIGVESGKATEICAAISIRMEALTDG